MLQLIDTHAHLYWDSFKDDFDEVLKRAKETDVKTIINIGVDTHTSIQAVQVSEKLALSGVEGFSTIGIHPHEASKYRDTKHEARSKLTEDIRELEKIYRENPEKVIGVGECGLDYFFKEEFMSGLSREELKNLQRTLFQAQIDLAKKLDLPLIIHCRDDRSKDPNNTEAWDEVVDMTKDYKGIYHCYSGLPQTTNNILQSTNFLISFAGTITYPKNNYLRKLAQNLPLEKICLETDCPFLPSQTNRGKRNEPSTVKEIAQLIAEIKGTTLKEISDQTSRNVFNLFRLEP